MGNAKIWQGVRNTLFCIGINSYNKGDTILGRYLTRIFDSEKVWSGIEMGFYGPIVTATECSAFTGYIHPHNEEFSI